LAGHVTGLEEKRTTYRILMGMPEGKRPLGRASRRWVNDIKVYLVGICWGFMDCINKRDRWRSLVNRVNESSKSMKCWENSRVAAQLAPFREWLSSMEQV
jgi:hypothetical protein